MRRCHPGAARGRALRADDAAAWWLRNVAVRERGDDGEILDDVIERLRLGLDALEPDDSMPGRGGGGRVLYVPPVDEATDLKDLVDTSRPSLTYLEIVLRDEDGFAIANEAFEVDLPDGQTWCGCLDGAGFARIDGIPRGHCVVRFPRLAAP